MLPGLYFLRREESITNLRSNDGVDGFNKS